MNSISSKEKWLLAILFIFIPVSLLIVFAIIPIISMFLLSFFEWNGIGFDFKWVGFNNYIKIISDPTYLATFKVNLYYLVAGIFQIIITYYFATILNEKIKGYTFFKTLFVLPTLISGVAIAMIFRLFLLPDGPFDQLLQLIGLKSLIGYWLGDPQRINYTLASISLYRNMGISFILYYGAMQTIPKNYYEYATLEGASLWQKTRFITIPMTSRVIKLNFLLLIIGVASVFEVPFIMSNGSNGSSTIVIKAMKLAFDSKHYGLASALLVIVALLILFLSYMQTIISKREE